MRTAAARQMGRPVVTEGGRSAVEGGMPTFSDISILSPNTYYSTYFPFCTPMET